MTMKISNANGNGSNGCNAFTNNLVALISFHPRADGSSGLDDEMPSECNHNAMVHKVRYDPAIANLQTYKI